MMDLSSCVRLTCVCEKTEFGTRFLSCSDGQKYLAYGTEQADEVTF